MTSTQTSADMADLRERADALLAELKEVAKPGADLDTTFEAAELAYALKSGIAKVYESARNKMWHLYGPGKHATPAGHVLHFTEPGPRRSCDYRVLEQKYPDAYAAVVKNTPPPVHAVGRLRLWSQP